MWPLLTNDWLYEDSHHCNHCNLANTHKPFIFPSICRHRLLRPCDFHAFRYSATERDGRRRRKPQLSCIRMRHRFAEHKCVEGHSNDDDQRWECITTHSSNLPNAEQPHRRSTTERKTTFPRVIVRSKGALSVAHFRNKPRRQSCSDCICMLVIEITSSKSPWQLRA